MTQLAGGCGESITKAQLTGVHVTTLPQQGIEAPGVMSEAKMLAPASPHIMRH